MAAETFHNFGEGVADAFDVVDYLLQHVQHAQVGDREQMQLVGDAAEDGVRLRGMVWAVTVVDRVVDPASLPVAIDYFRSECRRLGVEVRIVGEVE